MPGQFPPASIRVFGVGMREPPVLYVGLSWLEDTALPKCSDLWDLCSATISPGTQKPNTAKWGQGQMYSYFRMLQLADLPWTDGNHSPNHWETGMPTLPLELVVKTFCSWARRHFQCNCQCCFLITVNHSWFLQGSQYESNCELATNWHMKKKWFEVGLENMV